MSAVQGGRIASLLPRLLLACGLVGCNQPQPMPPMVSIPNPSPMLAPIPTPTTPPLVQRIPTVPGNPWKPEVAERSWKFIVIHHTASASGSVASIHQAHLKNKDKNGKPWLGIGYHFVIGNGHGMGDGEIEPTFRWQEQLQGAHAGVTDYNQLGIGVCLVGNFEEQQPTPAQLRAVKQLVAVLKADYGISGDRVIGHGEIKSTECPGKHFPMGEVRDSFARLDNSATAPVHLAGATHQGDPRR